MANINQPSLPSLRVYENRIDKSISAVNETI